MDLTYFIYLSRILESADGGLTATTGTLHADIHLAHAEVESLVGGSFGSELGGKRSALAGALEAGVTGGTPSDDVATSVNGT